ATRVGESRALILQPHLEISVRSKQGCETATAVIVCVLRPDDRRWPCRPLWKMSTRAGGLVRSRRCGSVLRPTAAQGAGPLVTAGPVERAGARERLVTGGVR